MAFETAAGLNSKPVFNIALLRRISIALLLCAFALPAGFLTRNTSHPHPHGHANDWHLHVGGVSVEPLTADHEALLSTTSPTAFVPALAVVGNVLGSLTIPVPHKAAAATHAELRRRHPPPR